MRGNTLNSLEGLDPVSHLALQHIEPPQEDLGSVAGWRRSVEQPAYPSAIKPQNTTRQQMEENAAVGLVTYTRHSLICADEKESEINE